MRFTLPRRGAAVLLSLCLCLGALPARAASAPSDWAKSEVEQAAALDLTRFYDGTNYQGPITRQEFAELAVRLYLRANNQDLVYSTDQPFTDVYGDVYVAQAYQLGLVQGVSDTQFAPEKTITRMEICVLYDRLLNKLGADLPAPYEAEGQALAAGAEGAVPDWATTGVASVVGVGVMQGTQNGYALDSTTSREQAALLSLRLYEMVQEARGGAFTDEERARIQELKALKEELGTPHFEGDPYVVQPQTDDITALVPGSLQEGFLQDGLNAINYARILAGLPGDVVLDADKNAEAQKGALLLAVSTFDHYPPQPAGMDDALYSAGRSATSHSNIGWGRKSLFAFNQGCMDDSDSNNISRVGHRRWLLDPDLKVVGMGCVNTSTTTMVMDRSRTPSLTPERVCWPGEGLFPLELMNARLAWSCTPDPEKYVLEGSTDLTVTVTRLRDGAVFQLDRSMNRDADNGPYLVVDSTGYGGGPAVIFRPGVEGYRYGDAFQVEIDNVQLKSGGTATISYTVKFFE